MEQKLSKFIGSMVGVAVGDSLSTQFEGTFGIQEVKEIGPRYTDDTAMTIGVAESLIEHKGFNYWHMAERFIQNYERALAQIRIGPPRIFRMMQSGRMGFGMLDRDLYPGGSSGNGAAMRVSPVGLLFMTIPSRSVRLPTIRQALRTVTSLRWKGLLYRPALLPSPFLQILKSSSTRNFSRR